MRDRMAKHNRVAAVPTAHAYRSFVDVFVVLDVGGPGRTRSPDGS